MLAARIVGIAMQPAAAEPFDIAVCAGTTGAAATAAIARQGPRGIFRLSLREPAPGLCRLAEGSFHFPQRAPVDA
jgi:hypothetical protein